jgi:hypothetical protein
MKMKLRKINKLGIICMILVVAMLLPVSAIAETEGSPEKVDLGTAEDFAVLAGTTITNTGDTVITGDVGLSPGTDITGFPPGTVDGTIYTVAAGGPAGSEVNPGLLTQAKADLTTAYNDAAGRTPSDNVNYAELAGLTLTPGVYNATSSMNLADNGILTLNANNPNDAFIFQTGTTLITGTNSVIKLLGLATFCQVFWQVGSSATLGEYSTFVGHILASESITVKTGAKVEGQLLALNGAVTLDNNTITNIPCKADTGSGEILLGTESAVLGSDIGSSQGTDSQVSPGRIALPTTSGYPVAEALSVMGMALLAIGGVLLKKKLV